MNKQIYEDLIAFHPGYYINEIIDDMEITQDEFAKRCDLTAKNLSEIINGKAKITNEIAQKLSIMFGTSTEMWLNLQAKYEVKVAEIEIRKKIDEQKKIFTMLDYKYFVNNSLIQAKTKTEDKIIQMCEFFHISSLEKLIIPDLSANFRNSSKTQEEKNIINNNAWLETAIRIGQQKNVADYDASKLKEYLYEIRSMTTQLSNQFVPRLEQIFSECGVIFVMLPKMKNANINGVVKWISNNKALLAINDRYSYADSFWFSLMHEIKHILQHKISQVMISYENGIDELNKKLEVEADEFACNFLIPKKEYDRFTSASDFSKKAIYNFAQKISIHPGIVVGRLQNDGLIEYSFFNELKIKYKIDLKNILSP